MKNKKNRRPSQATWNQEIAKVLGKTGIVWSKMKRLSTDKKEWTRFVKSEMQCKSNVTH